MCDILQLEDTEEILHARFVGFATNCTLIDLSKRNGIASFPVREIYSRVQKRAMRYGWCSAGKKQKSVIEAFFLQQSSSLFYWQYILPWSS